MDRNNFGAFGVVFMFNTIFLKNIRHIIFKIQTVFLRIYSCYKLSCYLVVAGIQFQ